jgi:hypothetical protein
MKNKECVEDLAPICHQILYTFFKLHPSNFTLQTSPFKLHPSNFTLQTSPFKLHPSSA